MKNKYYCKDANSEDDYDIYYDVDHISAAKKCALNVLKYRSRTIKDVDIKVKSDGGDVYIVQICFVRIKKNHS